MARALPLPTPPASEGPALVVARARTDDEIRESQRLRFLTFQAADDPSLEGFDVDRFDPWCDHLLVRETRTGRLVASTRLLRQENAVGAGGFYSATEFDLEELLEAPGRFLEVGRTCVHPEARTGAAIATLWSGIVPYLLEEGYANLFGCASISLRHGFPAVRALTERIRLEHAAPEGRRAVPRRMLPDVEVDGTPPAPMPPLLKAYIRLGAEICGDAYWDDDFRTADLPILLRRERVSQRYARHFLGEAPPG